jgi:hypothetical protein
MSNRKKNRKTEALLNGVSGPAETLPEYEPFPYGMSSGGVDENVIKPVGQGIAPLVLVREGCLDVFPGGFSLAPEVLEYLLDFFRQLLEHGDPPDVVGGGDFKVISLKRKAAPEFPGGIHGWATGSVDEELGPDNISGVHFPGSNQGGIKGDLGLGVQGLVPVDVPPDAGSGADHRSARVRGVPYSPP